jgi:hypothetical protein
MKKTRRAPQPLVKAPKSDVVLWRPRIVLANRIDEPVRRQPVIPAAAAASAVDPSEPRFVGSIFSLADAGATLAACAADARARATEAGSTRERVSAAMAAYRLEASFDQVLTGAYRQVAALMEERGLA